MITKGVILAGGLGSRLSPLTNVINKHLLPIGDKPMIMHPILNLAATGVTDVLLVVGGRNPGAFLELLGDGNHLGVSLYYAFQSSPTGIPGALAQAETFTGDDPFIVILGDNVFSRPLSRAAQGKRLSYTTQHLDRSQQAAIFTAAVPNPFDYGVLYEEDGKHRIVEKPSHPPRGAPAVTGAYIYPSDVYQVISKLKPSRRGELEITDVNNHYLSEDRMDIVPLACDWHDCGASIEQYQDVSRLLLSPQWKEGNA
jgi:glucose-1-phosphate thymidylyltransferase